MPKLITYSGESPAYLLMPDGNEFPEGSIEANAVQNNPDEGAKWRRRGVHVGWTKTRSVEIGVASFDPSREMPSEGVFMQLDRSACNDLIQALRKARDSAFGRDA